MEQNYFANGKLLQSSRSQILSMHIYFRCRCILLTLNQERESFKISNILHHAKIANITCHNSGYSKYRERSTCFIKKELREVALFWFSSRHQSASYINVTRYSLIRLQYSQYQMLYPRGSLSFMGFDVISCLNNVYLVLIQLQVSVLNRSCN